MSERRAVLAATAGAATVLLLLLVGLNGLGDQNDFFYELWPDYQLLGAGDVHGFIHGLPSYFGAALLRAPVARLATGLGAGWRATYFLTAVPCLAALPIFGVWLSRRRTSEDPARRQRILRAFCLFTVLDPIVWFAGIQGHPEELVGIALVFSGVLKAADGRVRWAVGLTAAGLACKPGLGEVLPVVAAALPSRWARPALMIGLGLLVLWALYNLTPLADLVSIHLLRAGSQTTGLPQPADLTWWTRFSWPTEHEHVLIGPIAGAVAAAWWQRRGRTLERGCGFEVELLWLLVLVLLLRTALDPWDVTYYNLPLLVALLCLEAGRGRATLTGAATVAVLLVVPTNRIVPVGLNARALLYGLVAIPALWWIFRRAFGLDGHPTAGSAGDPGVDPGNMAGPLRHRGAPARPHP